VCGHAEIDEAACRVWSAGIEISLTPTEYRMLRYLMANVEQVVSRTQILEHVWSYDYDGDWQIIETYVSSLRKKLEGNALPRIIHTIRGIGYSARRPATA
jgi:two-component system, OmpR family, response regulator